MKAYNERQAKGMELMMEVVQFQSLRVNDGQKSFEEEVWSFGSSAQGT